MADNEGYYEIKGEKTLGDIVCEICTGSGGYCAEGLAYSHAKRKICKWRIQCLYNIEKHISERKVGNGKH